MSNLQGLTEAITAWIVTHGLRILVALVLGATALYLCRRIVFRVFQPLVHASEAEMRKRAETLRSLVRSLVTVTLILVTAIVVLSELGIDIGPVLAAAGIVGIAVGFGAQQLVQDVISGFFILMEDQIRVGDVIETAGRSGLVESVSLRTTKLRDLAGNVHFIRNGKIDVVTNMTKEFSFYVLEVGVAYGTDVDAVFDALRDTDAELRADPVFGGDVLEPLEVLGLDRFADSALLIKARLKTRPSKQWRVGREFNRRLHLTFAARDIEIPYPQVTVRTASPAAPVAAAHRGE
jgi:small conductance mechanosensitive channel